MCICQYAVWIRTCVSTVVLIIKMTSTLSSFASSCPHPVRPAGRPEMLNMSPVSFCAALGTNEEAANC